MTEPLLPQIKGKTIKCDNPTSGLDLRKFYDAEAGQRFLDTQFPLVPESTLQGNKTKFCENMCPCTIPFPFSKLEGFKNE